MTKLSHSFALRFYATLLTGTGLIAIGLVLFMLLDNSTVASQDLSAVPAEVDYAAPDLTLVNLSGQSVSLKDHLGSVVLVNLWATWCPPCREEMPILQSFYEHYKEEGFVLIAIDQEETLAIVSPFVKQFGLAFPVWLDLNYLAQRKFHTINLPSSFVIDRNGKVRLMWIGGISKKNLEKYVPALIEG